MTSAMDRVIQRRPWWTRWRLWAGSVASIALVLLIYLFATSNLSLRSLSVPASSLTIEPSTNGLFRDFTPVRGKVAARDTIFLDALEGGQVETVFVRAGDVVQQGEPLLKFRNTQLELDVLDREGRLVESITQLHAYEKQLEDTRLANEKTAAEISYNITRLKRASDRNQVLVSKGFASLQSRDQIQDELAYQQRLQPMQGASNSRQEALRAAQIPQIKTEIAGLNRSLDVTKSKLDELVVKAPVAGRVTDIVQNVGENRNRGDRIGEIVPDTGFKVTATVDEFYLGRVRTGQVGEATIEGQKHILKVDRVYPQVKDGAFTVDLAFAGPSPRNILPGQAVDGRLFLGDDTHALLLPTGAFLERSGGSWVMVVDRSGHHANRRRVQLGRRNSEQVEVLSGLTPGERVIISDYSGYENVDRLNIGG